MYVLTCFDLLFGSEVVLQLDLLEKRFNVLGGFIDDYLCI